jgi:hypothetical protein
MSPPALAVSHASPHFAVYMLQRLVVDCIETRGAEAAVLAAASRMRLLWVPTNKMYIHTPT